MASETDIETMLLGPVLPDRACGDCTACCTVLTVNSPDFRKPGGEPCQYLAAHGCGIHAERPAICRSWFCVWRRVAALPDDARPDRSGLLVSLNFEREPRNCLEAVSISVRAIAGRDKVDKAMAATVLDSLCTQLVPVWFSDGDDKMLMHPEHQVALHVVSGDPAPAHLQGEVAAWRERYAVFAPKG
ncbi:YkgJ family cysteine cluster protein [Sphingomonas sp. KR3-1]|uniref:YkgJ family cysteine cluster protein n=1 Tax=Sphingomonas sp. KR3-1 TaxID=3156611 RepID=UPI0032B57771